MTTQRIYLYSTAIIATVMALIWSIYSGRLINFDGILYLRTAEALYSHDYSLAYSIYRWPLYPALIASIGHITHLSLIHSAYVLNAIIQILLTLSFIQLVKQLGGNNRCLWLALIVLIANPYLNDYRSFITRDFGYWAFFLLSLNLIIATVENLRWNFAFLAGLALLIATMFRIEGLAIAFLLPTTLLFINTLTMKRRLQYWTLTLLPTILGLITLYIVTSLQGHISIRSVGRMDHVLNVLSALPAIGDNVSAIIGQMKTNVLDYQAQHGASVIVIAGLLGLLLFEIIKVTNPLFFLLAGYTAKRHFVPRSFAKTLCKTAFFLNLAILIYFIGTFNFLSGRYVIPAALILLSLVPFTIDHLYHYFCVCGERNIKYWYYPATMVILSGFIVYNALHLHYDKAYIRSAGEWTRTHVPSNVTIKSNSAEFLFYSRGVIKNWNEVYITKNQKLLVDAKNNEVLALRLTKKQSLSLLPTLGQWQRLATFKNVHGDKLIVIQKDSS